MIGRLINRGVGAVAAYALDRSRLERCGYALLEVFCVSIIGLIPLFFAAYLAPSAPGTELSEANDSLNRMVNSGQLYLYCFSFVGTLSWIFFRSVRGCHIFQVVTFGVLIIGLSGASVFIPAKNPALLTKLPDYQVTLSIVLYASALVLYFFLLMCHSAVAETPDDAVSKSVDGLIKRTERIV